MSQDLELETKQTKTPEGHIIVSNKLTNEPIAVIKMTKNIYGDKKIAASWHPEFKAMYPDIEKNLLHRNLTNHNHKYGNPEFESLNDAVGATSYRAQQFMDDLHRKDPIKTKYNGKVQGEEEGAQPRHVYHVFDDDNKHIGHIETRDDPSTIHPKSEVKAFLHKEELDKIPDSVKESAVKKHGGTNLDSTMDRLRYMLDNKSKEPRFIGTTASKNNKAESYKTKLSPEEASKAYEEHLRGKLGDNFTFTRHSPTAFMAHKPASGYNKSETHHVISTPGELHHVTATVDSPEYQYADKNTQVVESAE